MKVNSFVYLLAIGVVGQATVQLRAAPAPAISGEKAIQQLKSSGQYDSLRAAFLERQHRVVAAQQGYCTENPENGFQAEFDGSGLKATRPGAVFGLRFARYGRDSQFETPRPALISTQGSNLEYRRGEITEWYRNDAAGLEQGFTLQRRPASTGSGPLTLELLVEGNLRPVMDGRDVRLEKNGVGVLRYAQLSAWDAAGNKLPARMAVAENRIRLLVTDSAAQYPITIDPLVQQQMAAADGLPGDQFGKSVSLSGNTAVIGAPTKSVNGKGNQGVVYIFVRSGNAWSFQQELFASDGAAGDQFGFSVGVSGDIAVIGAWGKTIGANSIQGAAYMFARSGTTWTQQARVTASDGAQNDRLGSAVAVSGTTAVVGAPGKASATGAAYVFVSSGGVWSQQQKLTNSDAAIGDNFAGSVAVDVNTAVMGASGKSPSGAAYVFFRTGTAWAQQQKLLPSDGAAGDFFGWSVGVSGNTAIVGAYGKSFFTGAAYVFSRSGTTWTQQQKLTASDGVSGVDQFGWAVAVNGTSAVIGAWKKNVGGNPGRGQAYLFSFTGGGWVEEQKLTASDGMSLDEYGYSVSISGGTPLVGAPGKGGGNLTGGAYVYITLVAPPPVAGDFDGNRVPDVVWQNEATRQSVVHYYGGAGGSTDIGWNWLYSGTGAAGWHIVAIADFNSDGVPDVVSQHDTTRQVVVHYFGGAGGATDLGWNWLYANPIAGWHVVAAADFNGDGVPDLVWQEDATNRVVVHYYGGAGGATDLGWNWLYANPIAGWRIAAASDFNGDGVPDLVWQSDSGQVVVHYYGGAAGATDLGWNWLYANPISGWLVVSTGDFDQNGVPDLVWQNTTTGQVVVHYYGGAGGATDIGWNYLFASGISGWTVR